MATYTKLTSQNNFTDGTIGGQTPTGGDTIIFEVGSHTGKQFFKDFHGISEDNPLVFDLNGQTIDGLDANQIFTLRDCSYIHVKNGTLHNSSTQGFYSTSSLGVSVDNLTVYDCPSTGIRVGYQSAEADPSKWRVNFIDPYARVTNCTVHTTTNVGEGIYVGASNADWIKFAADGTVWRYCFLASGTISGNTVYNTAYDGIQIGSCQDAKVFDNVVYNYATKDDNVDQNGIQMGSGTRGICYNNFVRNTAALTGGAGIFIQGDGVDVFNNISYDCYNGVHIQSGTWVTANRRSNLYNNTFVGIGNSGIYLNSKYLRDVKTYNNIFHFDTEPNPPTTEYIEDVSKPPTYDESGNLWTYELLNSKYDIFTAPDNFDFTLKAGSPALGNGNNIKCIYSKLLSNYSGDLRSRSGAWDIGAY